MFRDDVKVKWLKNTKTYKSVQFVCFGIQCQILHDWRNCLRRMQYYRQANGGKTRMVDGEWM